MPIRRFRNASFDGIDGATGVGPVGGRNALRIDAGSGARPIIPMSARNRALAAVSRFMPASPRARCAARAFELRFRPAPFRPAWARRRASTTACSSGVLPCHDTSPPRRLPALLPLAPPARPCSAARARIAFVHFGIFRVMPAMLPYLRRWTPTLLASALLPYFRGHYTTYVVLVIGRLLRVAPRRGAPRWEETEPRFGLVQHRAEHPVAHPRCTARPLTQPSWSASPGGHSCPLATYARRPG